MRNPIDYWTYPHNRKNFLDNFAKKYQIFSPKDWGNVTKNQIIQFGGNGLLFKYKGSVFQLLKVVYPEIKWNRDWFHRLPLKGESDLNPIEKQRKFLQALSQKLEIKHPRDWARVSLKSLELNGGYKIAQIYQNDISKALKLTFPEINWKESWFPNKNKEKHVFTQEAQLLVNIASKFGIKNSKDWGNISIKQIEENGGSLLLNFHENSIFKMLQHVFPEMKWKSKWFEKQPKIQIKKISKRKNDKTLSSLKNQKKILDSIGKKLGVVKPHDWGKVTWREVKREGGNKLLSRYGGSLRNALQTIYSEIDWKTEWFVNILSDFKYPHSYWKDRENQRRFLRDLEIRFKILKPSDWGRVLCKRVIEEGGGTLLNLNGGSLFKTLENVFSEIEWKREWFARISKFPSDFFDNLKNQRIFFDEIATEYNIVKASDWSRITLSLIKNKGGENLIRKYNNSIANAVRTIYPYLYLPYSGVQTSDPQSSLFVRTKSFFPVK